MNKQNFIKNSKIYIFLLIGLAVFSISAQSSAAQTKDQTAVADVLRQNAAAIEKGDLEALDKLWSTGKDVIVYESGYANYGWLDYRDKHLAPELKDFKDLKYAVSDIIVKVDKKNAYATYKYTLVAEFKGRKTESAGVGTMIFEKQGGRWLIVHSHTSAAY